MATFFRMDGWVKSVQGYAVPGAQVFVLNQPANTPNTLKAALPSPLVSIFSDNAGLVPLSQPVITDGFGHYNFYALPGLYTVAVYLGGSLQQVYQDQLLG